MLLIGARLLVFKKNVSVRCMFVKKEGDGSSLSRLKIYILALEERLTQNLDSENLGVRCALLSV
jgi:hypothetical protein